MPRGTDWDYRLYRHAWTTYQIALADSALSARVSDVAHDMPVPAAGDPPGRVARTELYRRVAESQVDACLDQELAPEPPRCRPGHHAAAVLAPGTGRRGGPPLDAAVRQACADTARAVLWRETAWLEELADRLRPGRLPPAPGPRDVVRRDLAVLVRAAAHVSAGTFLSPPLGTVELAGLLRRPDPAARPAAVPTAPAAPVLGGGPRTGAVGVRALDRTAPGVPWHVPARGRAGSTGRERG